ncbi:hypothetical protein ACFXAF_25470, partial [Kitasatospora sp. NPDC059463]|uniref:hypothetical protein n=1 Tax=Kitasatospora sp. NPDC059463 TaxID=3346842 RepID=UPI0036B612FB
MRHTHYAQAGLATSVALAALLVSSPQYTAAAAGTRTFAYTGAPEQYVVPAGVCEIVVDAFGAAGGSAVYGSPGGKGGEVRATLQVHAGDVLTVDVGQAGSGGDLLVPDSMAYGGYGGGGQGGSATSEHRPGNGAIGAGGGGATTVTAPPPPRGSPPRAGGGAGAAPRT